MGGRHPGAAHRDHLTRRLKTPAAHPSALYTLALSSHVDTAVSVTRTDLRAAAFA
jgi:hypothetical protein